MNKVIEWIINDFKNVRLIEWILLVVFIVLAIVVLKYDISQINECNKKIAECWKTIGIYNKTLTNNLTIPNLQVNDLNENT